MNSDFTFIQLPLIAKPFIHKEESAFYDVYWDFFERRIGGKFVKAPIYDIKELPLWIAALGGTLEHEGLTADVLDLTSYSGCDIDYDAIARELSQVTSRVVGMSPFTNSFSVAVRVSRLVKKVLGRDVFVVLGGPHVSYTDRSCLEEEDIDIVVRGEGEFILPDLLRCLHDGGDLRGIPGISWKRDGEINVNPFSKEAIISDRLPMPAYHLIPNDIYRGQIPFARIYTSRGCTYNCAYCADTIWKGRKPLYQSMERTVTQAELLRKYFDIDLLYVGDESFTTNPSYVEEFGMEMRNRGFRWIAQTRCDLVTPRILRKMHEGNCRLIKYGAESANQELLDLIRKGIRVEQIRASCKMAKDAGLNVLLYWMVGLPGESRDTAYRTIAYAEKLLEEGLADIVEYYITTPYPGTDLYHNFERYHLTIIGENFDSWREDQPSVTRTEYLDEQEIFEIWKDGLSRFSTMMKRNIGRSI